MAIYYRIVRDRYCGYEVQSWRWMWPFWVQAGGTNTHTTIEAARRYAEGHARGVEEYLGKWTPE